MNEETAVLAPEPEPEPEPTHAAPFQVHCKPKPCVMPQIVSLTEYCSHDGTLPLGGLPATHATPFHVQP
eukprot:g3641.t1